MEKKMFFLKIICIYLVCSFLFIQPIYADDIDDSEDFFPSYDDVLEASNNLNSNLSINSRAYIVLDRNTNCVLLEKNAMQKRKMASTTKIMTATVVIENCNLSTIIEVPRLAANTGGSRLGLKTGDKISIKDLLYGLMLRSGNDAAVALALYVGGSLDGFATLMNNKADELGLKNTHFETPHGLDSPNHYTTAYELSILANYAMKNKTFANIVGTKTCTININGYSKSIDNTNELLGNLNGVYGIKTGFTNGANRCLVSCCKRGNLDLICVVLGADTKKFRTTDSIKLLEYSFQHFELIDIGKIAKAEFENWKKSYINNVVVDKGVSNSVSVDIKDFDHSIIPIDKDKKNSLCFEFNCETNFIAPIDKDCIIGELVLKIDDQPIATTSIMTTDSIAKKSIWDYFIQFAIQFKTDIFCAF